MGAQLAKRLNRSLRIFPQIEFSENAKYEHIVAAELISGKKPDIKITLSVIGSDFQIQVWQELLKIPFGKTTSYGEIASNLNTPIGRARVIGTAIGKNPIAYLIPCHRVIQLSGKLGGYRWGIDKKREILTFESKF
jgi:AraC family transcriptional regulator, regulatory protein of adaptative response / methylated-DNA-[protein]-cysteine methyltransferase